MIILILSKKIWTKSTVQEKYVCDTLITHIIKECIKIRGSQLVSGRKSYQLVPSCHNTLTARCFHLSNYVLLLTLFFFLSNLVAACIFFSPFSFNVCGEVQLSYFISKCIETQEIRCDCSFGSNNNVKKENKLTCSSGIPSGLIWQGLSDFTIPSVLHTFNPIVTYH